MRGLVGDIEIGGAAATEGALSERRVIGGFHRDLRIRHRLDMRHHDTTDAAIEKAGDGRGGIIRHAGDGGEPVALGGDAGRFDVAPVETAMLAVNVDEVDMASEKLNDGRRGKGKVDAANPLTGGSSLLDDIGFCHCFLPGFPQT